MDAAAWGALALMLCGALLLYGGYALSVTHRRLRAAYAYLRLEREKVARLARDLSVVSAERDFLKANAERAAANAQASRSVLRRRRHRSASS